MKRFQTAIYTSVVAIALLGSGCTKVINQSPEASCDFVQNRSKQRVSWKTDLPLYFRVHKDVPTVAHESLKKAAAEWNSVSSKEVIKIIRWDAKGTADQGYSDGAPTIYWETTWEASRSTEQARTTVIWTDDKIKDADIKINAKNFKFSYVGDDFDDSKVDFVSLMVHEMGHALGFAHSEEKESVMYPLLAKGYDRRDIDHLADLESYTCEYGDQIVDPEVLALAMSGGETAETEEEEVIAEVDEEATQGDESEGDPEEVTSASSI